MDAEQPNITLLLLQAELDRVSSVITEKGNIYDRILALAALIFSIGFSVGLQKGREIVLVLLPLPIILLIAFSFSVLIEQLAQGGYKRFLEERANEMADYNVLNWETAIAPRIGHKSWTDQVIVPGLYLVFFVTVWIVSIDTTWDSFSSWRVAVLAAFVLSAVCVITSVVESRSAATRAYGAALGSFLRVQPSGREAVTNHQPEDPGQP